MKGGCKEYPNIGVRIDPRSITSARMPESLKVYSGFLYRGLFFLMSNGYMTKTEIIREEEKIQRLLPFNKTNDKTRSSVWFNTDSYLIEIFRTSEKNFKIYALKIIINKGYYYSPYCFYSK